MHNQNVIFENDGHSLSGYVSDRDAIDMVILPSAAYRLPVCVGQASWAVLDVVDPVALESGPIKHSVGALAMASVLRPVARVARSVGPSAGADSVAHPVGHAALVQTRVCLGHGGRPKNVIPLARARHVVVGAVGVLRVQHVTRSMDVERFH